jgi:membrane-associated phospholipid phosphatase
VAYLAAFAVLVPVTLYFSLVEHSRILVDGALVIGAMMAIALAANRWIKGSGHMAFAAFSAVVFTRVAPLFAVGVTVFIPLLAWSRVRMRRHSVVEVVGGCALGACAGCVMLFLY